MQESNALASSDESSRRFWIPLAVGLGSGFLLAFFGVGGGIFAVPALVIFLDFSLKRAIGTSLVSIAPVALVGIVTELLVHQENLHIPVALLLSFGAILGTFVGKKLFLKSAEGSLRWIYAIFLIVVSMQLSGMFSLLNQPLWSWGTEPMELGAASFGIGIFAGVSSTLFGIGGGVIAVPLMLLLFKDLQFHGARATSLAMIVPTAAMGVWHHRSMDTIDWKIAWTLMIPALIGAVAGIFIVQQIAPQTLKMAFSILLMLAAWRLLRDVKKP